MKPVTGFDALTIAEARVFVRTAFRLQGPRTILERVATEVYCIGMLRKCGFTAKEARVIVRGAFKRDEDATIGLG